MLSFPRWLIVFWALSALVYLGAAGWLFAQPPYSMLFSTVDMAFVGVIAGCGWGLLSWQEWHRAARY